ncbi:MAG: hypothetical protein ACP5MV_02100 [Candidatus Parvarchaeum sp.]
MNSGFYEAISIAVVGVLIALSVIRFTAAFYKNPLKAVQLIRLNKNSTTIFIIFLAMNFVFLAGYLLQLFNSLNNSDLLGILVYALGTSFFFFALTNVISEKYKLD